LDGAAHIDIVLFCHVYSPFYFAVDLLPTVGLLATVGLLPAVGLLPTVGYPVAVEIWQ
jgi:hypothetical protein